MTRRQAVLALVLAAVAVLASGAPVWLRGTTSSSLEVAVGLAVTGTTAAPGVAAGGLVVLAAALALALGRRVGTLVAAAVAALGGVLVTVSALGAPGRASSALGAAAADLVGVADVGDVRITAWPFVAAGMGVVTVLVAVTAALSSRAWARPSARHDAPADQAAVPGLTARPRPTGERPAGTSDVRQGDGPTRPAPGRDAGEVWDALSRGEDPT